MSPFFISEIWSLLWSQQSAVFSSSWACHSPCLPHFTPGPHLQSCSPGRHRQSTPLHKPLDSLLSVPDRTTLYGGNDTCLAPVTLLTSLSPLVAFDHNLTLFPSARSYPDHSLQLACLPLLPASSSSTSSSTSFNKPSYINSTPSLSALGFSIVYHNSHLTHPSTQDQYVFPV